MRKLFQTMILRSVTFSSHDVCLHHYHFIISSLEKEFDHFFLMFLYFLLTNTFSLFVFNDQNECDFKCWIQKLNISIPTISYQVPILGTINITKLLISNLNLNNIEANFYPKPDVIQDGMELKMSVHGSILGQILVDDLLLSDTASFDGEISNLNFSIALKSIKDNNGLIDHLEMFSDTCAITVDNVDVDIQTDSDILRPLIYLLKPALISVIKTLMGPLICDSLPEQISNETKAIFGEINDVIIPYLNDTSPIVIPIGEGMTDLQTSIIVDFLRYVLTDFIGVDGPLNINDLFNRFTNQTGTINLPTLLEYFGVPFPLETSSYIDAIQSTINLTLLDLNFSGFNTWNLFDILSPISEHILDSNTGMNEFGLNISFGINVSSNGTIVSTGDIYLTEVANLNMLLKNNKMHFQLQLASPEGVGLNYSSKMCFSENCILSLASNDGTGITLINFNTSVDFIDIEAGSEDMEKEIRTFINNIFTILLENYRPVIPSFLNGFINKYGVEYANAFLNQTLKDNECDFVPDDPYIEFDLISTIIALCCSIFGTFLIYILIRVAEHIKTKMNSQPFALNTYENEKNDLNPLEGIKYNRYTAFFRTDKQCSLLMTPRLPIYVRLLMPFLVFLNISTFVSSNQSIGASVFVKFFIGSLKEISMPSMFDFGLVNSVKNMWEAKAYALSILIFCMSCAWPYAKLVLMLFCWVCPTTILSPKRRETFLKFLDAVGKWSLMDSFVMILMIIAFHFGYDFPIIGEKVKEEFTVDLFVYPAYGILALVIGTIFSLVLSHVMLALDRYVDKSIDENSDVVKEYKALFNFTHNRFLKFFIPVVLILTIAVVGSGIYIKTFSFEIDGLTGWAMDLLGTPNSHSYSVIDLALALPRSAQYPNSFTVRFIQVVYFIIALIMPVLEMVCLLLLWIVPLTRKAQVILYKACEVMYAWSCLDVFVVSIIACMLQIHKLTTFMLGDKCDSIDPIIQMFFADEPYVVGHESCYDVVTVLLSGSWMLVSAAIVQNIATIIVNIVARKALDARHATDSASSSNMNTVPLIARKTSSESS